MPHCSKSHVVAKMYSLYRSITLLSCFMNKHEVIPLINRGSYMSVHVILNLLNELGKKR